MSIKVNISSAVRKINNSIQLPKNVMQNAYKLFISKTPIDTGNARNKTKLKGTVIDADYAYAERLDNGWSKQSSGMTKPTLNFIKQEIKKKAGK